VGFGVVTVVGSYAFLALKFIIYLSGVFGVGDFLEHTLPWNNSVHLTVKGQNIQVSVRACLDICYSSIKPRTKDDSRKFT